MTSRTFARLIFTAFAGLGASPALAGNIFVTGHDPDFHASLGGNALGAQHIIQDSLIFARDGSTAPILVLQSNTNNLLLGDHTDSLNGLNASGYSASSTPGNHYVVANDAQFATDAAGGFAGFSAIFIPSDHGGTLTGDDLVMLDSGPVTSAIIAFINGGGGLVALAEDGNHTAASGGATPALFGFLPFLVSSTAFSQAESGNTLTPAGLSLGLVNSDINGNFSHNIFTATGGMTVADLDANGEILSLMSTGPVTPGGVVPEPSTLALLGLVFAGMGWARRHKLN